MNDRPITLTCSLADQVLSRAKSIGIFNLSMGMVAELARRPEIAKLTLLANRTHAGQLPDGVEVRWDDTPARGRLGRLWWDQWRVYSAAAATGNDWLFLPKGFASFTRRCPVRLTACVADTIHDFYREHYPQAVSGFEQQYFVRSFWGTVKHARLIFTISDFTTGEILRLAKARGLTPPPVHTIGIGFTRPTTPPVPRENRIVLIAAHCPRKRTDLALDWTARWQRDSGFTGEVDCVGLLPPGLNFPTRPGWRWHDRLPEREHRQLIARSKALVFFTEYEGFGMPPVEAALAGTCPVFSAIPATREVMGDCGCPFNNTDYELFRVAMDSALKCPPEQIAAWADTLLARHNWPRVLDRFVAGLQAEQRGNLLTPARP